MFVKMLDEIIGKYGDLEKLSDSKLKELMTELNSFEEKLMFVSAVMDDNTIIH